MNPDYFATVRQLLEAMGYQVIRKTIGNETKMMVVGPQAQVKVEVNEVFRGTLLPVQQRPLSPATEEEFAQAVTLPLLATAELYGSKLVAAMDRQHPRDLFDVLILYDSLGLTPEIVDCFVAYLAGHNRPVHELLAPKRQPIQRMTRNAISLEALQQIRERLFHELPRALTTEHRTFLLSLVQLQPRWDCLPFPHLQDLPSIHWKLLNLAKLRGEKLAAQRELLQACFLQ